MKYENLILITLNNTLHIKADNLEPIEVDSSCIRELNRHTLVNFKSQYGTRIGEVEHFYYLEKGINIQELSDRIEVREIQIRLAKSGGYKEGSEIKPATIVNGKPYKITYIAFLLPSKEDKCKCFRLGEGSPWQTYNCEIHNENLEQCLEIVDKKSYTIEEIERAIDETFEYNPKTSEVMKWNIINNLKK